MGFGPVHLNAFNKGRLNYLDLTNTTTVTQSGLYTIAPLGKTQTGIQTLRIPRDSTSFLYLEFRPNWLQDGMFMTGDGEGVYVHLAPGYGTLSRSYILDGNPEDSYYKVLPLGRSIVDQEKGISLKVISQTMDQVVVEINFGVNGDGSNPTPTTDTVSPTPPTDLQASVETATSVKLSWGASTDNIAIGAYDIYRNGTKIASTSQLSYIDTTVKSGMTYSFTVKAADTSNNYSTSSNTATIMMPTIDTQSPTIPAGLKLVSVSEYQATIAWLASTDNIGVTGYNIYRNGTKIASTASLNFGDATVLPGASHSYAVAAYDKTGNTSALSPTLAITIPKSTSNNGNIAGTVRNVRIGTPLVGKTINLWADGHRGDFIRSTTTGNLGDFQFTNLTPGRYEVKLQDSNNRTKKYGTQVESNNTTIMSLEVR